MTRRHDERYKRAMERLAYKHEREDATRAKVLKAVQDAAEKSSKPLSLPTDFVDRYTDHKLGRRRPKS